LVALNSPGHDPLHKVTIIPRGRALGLTMALPEKDRYSYSKMELEARIAMAFGGRVAEEIIYGKENVTTGASNDIQQATALARRMVTEFGFSDKLGPLRYDDNTEEVFLGHSVTQHKAVSDATTKLIDDEVRSIVEGGESRARKILDEHMDDLHALAKGLLEFESLSRTDVDAIMRGDKVTREDSSGKQGKDGSGGFEPEPQPEG
jgi:cell division protease FtsH